MSGGSGHSDKTQTLSESLLNIETPVKKVNHPPSDSNVHAAAEN